MADAQDIGQLRTVFKRIFTLMDQQQHYDMMTTSKQVIQYQERN